MDNVGHYKEHAYSPNQLLDTLAARLQLASDAALARKLNVTKSVIKKIRCHMVPVGGSLLMRMNDVSAIKIEELRRLMGDRRHRLRVGMRGAHEQFPNCIELHCSTLQVGEPTRNSKV
jgi:hypothetical protein